MKFLTQMKAPMSSTMKTWITLLLGALLIMVSMVGCGAGNDTAGDRLGNIPSDVQIDQGIVGTEDEIAEVNGRVLLYESQISLPDSGANVAPVRYYLPFEAGKHRGVSQGVNGSYSHKGKLWNAIDWNLTGYNDYRLPVLAAAPGRVVLASSFKRFGNCVVLRHLDGSKTRYAHLDQINVSLGQQVGQAENIGLVGTTGHSTGPHLHFEILDPQMNGLFPVFAEPIATPVGDMPCTTSSEDVGCYQSRNAPAADLP